MGRTRGVEREGAKSTARRLLIRPRRTTLVKEGGAGYARPVQLRGGAFALGIAVVMLGAAAHAQSPPEASSLPAPAPAADKKAFDAKEAELRFQRARQLFDEGDYALALVEFKRAYDLSPNYRVLFNIAQIQIQLLDYASARVALEKFLRDGGTEIAAPKRAQTEADLQMLRQRTAHLALTTSPSADVTIDDIAAGSTPLASPLLVNAGQRKVVVSRTGFVPFAKVITLAGGDSLDLSVTLVPMPERTPGGPQLVTRTTKNYTPATVGWIATGVLGVGSAVFGGLYLSKQSQIDDLNDPRNAVSDVTRKDTEASATRLAVAADVFGVLAIAAAATSVYFSIRPPDTETVTTAKLRITPTPAGMMATF